MCEQQCDSCLDLGYIIECKYGIGKIKSSITGDVLKFTRDCFIKPTNKRLIERELHYQSFPDVKSIYLFRRHEKTIYDMLEIGYWPWYINDYENNKVEKINILLDELKQDILKNRSKYKSIHDDDLTKVIPETRFIRELGPSQFYEWYDKHKKESHQQKIFDLFISWYADDLIENDFKNKKWEELLTHITAVPHYGALDVIPFSLYEEYEDCRAHHLRYDIRYSSDDYPLLDYVEAYPLYESLVKYFDYRHPFTKEDVKMVISNAREAVYHCYFSDGSGRSAAYYRGNRNNTFLCEEKLMNTFIDNLNAVKTQFAVKAMDNFEYCKKSIILWKEFIESYELSISWYLTAHSPEDAKYMLTIVPDQSK